MRYKLDAIHNSDERTSMWHGGVCVGEVYRYHFPVIRWWYKFNGRVNVQGPYWTRWGAIRGLRRAWPEECSYRKLSEDCLARSCRDDDGTED